MEHRGVIYCATTNSKYVEAALISAIALRQIEPKLPITIISDCPLLQTFPLAEFGITPRFLTDADWGGSGTFGSRWIKTQLLSFSPYTETIFIDADIIPLKSIQGLWGYLEKGDIAMVSDRNPTVAECDHIAQEEKNYTLERVPETTRHFNSGVMVWRNTPITQELFRQWHQEWQRFHKQDQLALVRAIQTTQVSVVSLPVTYNISPIDSAPVLLPNNEVYLLHCWGGVVLAGTFPSFARTFYPEIVDRVTCSSPMENTVPVPS
jgi:hypothetical protein